MPEFYVLCEASDPGAFAVEPYGYSGAEDDSDLPQEYMRLGTLADLADKTPYVYAKLEEDGIYCEYRDPREFLTEKFGLTPDHGHLLRQGQIKIQ